jgi:hypothetical protein
LNPEDVTGHSDSKLHKERKSHVLAELGQIIQKEYLQDNSVVSSWQTEEGLKFS